MKKIAPIVSLLFLSSCSITYVNICEPSGLVESNLEKVKRSISELRAISVAIESYGVEYNKYPTIGTPKILIDQSSFENLWQIAPELAIYKRFLPDDPWGRPYIYWSSGMHFALICMGSDGAVDSWDDLVMIINENTKEKEPVKSRSVYCAEDDIIVIDGVFVQRPEGKIRNCSE